MRVRDRLPHLLVGAVAAASALVLALFAAMHAGVDLPLADVPPLAPVALLYAVAAPAFGVVAYAALVDRPWWRTAAVAVFGAALLLIAVRALIVTAHGVSPIPFVLGAALLAAALAAAVGPPARR